MRKLFISADIEGTAGIAHWDETEKTKADYAYFAKQMTAEVKAACEGAHDAGVEEILVKDAHDTGRNIDPSALPEYARVLRGWGSHPFSMMYGLDAGFEGVVFTGYHSAAETNANPLSHTMSGANNHVLINGELCSELMINCLTASYVGVPVFAVAGDAGLCAWIKGVNPEIGVIPVSFGSGDGTLGMHPAVACRSIRETVFEALKKPAQSCMFPLPGHFRAEVDFKQHTRATSSGFYPGATQTGPRTIAFESGDWFDILRFFHFVL